MAQDKVSIRWLLHYLAWQQNLALKAAASCSFAEMYARKSCQDELNISSLSFYAVGSEDYDAYHAHKWQNEPTVCSPGAQGHPKTQCL